MLDLYGIPTAFRKSQRTCANPLCSRVLSLLNKQDLCFGCQERSRMQRFDSPRVMISRRDYDLRQIAGRPINRA